MRSTWDGMRCVLCPMTGEQWCALCYENMRGRANNRGHFGFRAARAPKGASCMVVNRKVERNGTASAQLQLPLSPPWSTDLKELVAFVSLAKWPDGKPRCTGTMTIFVEGGCWKIYLNDKDAGVGHCVTGSTLEDALVSASLAVDDNSTPWRGSQGPSKGSQRRS
jgi:hypothetical protein